VFYDAMSIKKINGEPHDQGGTAEPDILDLAKQKPLQISVDGKQAKFGDPQLAEAIEVLTDLPRPRTVPATIKIFEQESRVWLRKLKQLEDEKNPQMWGDGNGNRIVVVISQLYSRQAATPAQPLLSVALSTILNFQKELERWKNFTIIFSPTLGFTKFRPDSGA
jgi:hypothetical protein